MPPFGFATYDSLSLLFASQGDLCIGIVFRSLFYAIPNLCICRNRTAHEQSDAQKASRWLSRVDDAESEWDIELNLWDVIGFDPRKLKYWNFFQMHRDAQPDWYHIKILRSNFICDGLYHGSLSHHCCRRLCVLSYNAERKCAAVCSGMNNSTPYHLKMMIRGCLYVYIRSFAEILNTWQKGAFVVYW